MPYAVGMNDTTAGIARAKAVMRQRMRVARRVISEADRRRYAEAVATRLLEADPAKLPALRCQPGLDKPSTQGANQRLAEGAPRPRRWFVYVSYGSELGTHGLIRSLLARGDAVSVPVLGEAEGWMHTQPIASWDALVPDERGRLALPAAAPATGPRRGNRAVLGSEPLSAQTSAQDAQTPDVVLLPCLAVTPGGERLGQGGGYYDRYLAAHPGVAAIALAYDEQVVEGLPTEAHDRRVDAVVTPTRWIGLGAGV